MANTASLGTAKLVAELDATAFTVGLKKIENQTRVAFDQIVIEVDRAADISFGDGIAAELNAASSASDGYAETLREQNSELQAIIAAQEEANQTYAQTTEKLKTVEKEVAKVSKAMSQGGGKQMPQPQHLPAPVRESLTRWRKLLSLPKKYAPAFPLRRTVPPERL